MIRLFSPCAFGHTDWHRGPTVDGVTPKLCNRCQQPIGTLLSGEMIATPLVQHVAGAPTGKVTREHKRNVVTPLREGLRGRG